MRAVTILASAVGALGVASIALAAVINPFGAAQVGQLSDGRILLPTNQWISPVGDRLTVNNGRITSSTLSPDGKRVAALTWNNFTGFLSILDPATGRVVQQVGTGTTGDPTIGDATVSPDGPLYSADGTTLWMPQSADLVRFTVASDGTVANPVVIKLDGPHGAAIPSGMALSQDGLRLYVALNGSNTLGVINTTTNTLEKQIPVGNAPRQVVLVGDRAFVSNEGGRAAAGSDFTNLSDKTPIVSDPSTGAASTGTLSVVDVGHETETGTIHVGLQPTALYLHGTTLFVANSNDDSVSIVNTEAEQVTQTFNVNPVPGARVGSYPNAITMPDDKHVLVSIGRDNALAEYSYTDPVTPIKFVGLLPTDWYPVNVQMDSALGKIVVTNDKGIGARGPASTIDKGPGTQPGTGHNTYDDTGTLTSFALPPDSSLGGYTHTVFANNAWNHLGTSPDQQTAPLAVPAHLGQASKIKHVFLIVKENRTYDQVFGDVAKGNGDASLAQFGANVTPNQHALTDRFGLFDNFYDPGTLSADGHNWLVQADANDYIEKEFGAFYRSYPAQGGDALAYQRNGFLWNAAQMVGKSAAAFGEYANFFEVPASGTPAWRLWYKDSQILEGKASGPLPIPIDKYKTRSDIPSLNAILDPSYPRFDLNVPDQYRADIWQRAFRTAVKSGNLANLNLIWLPDNHTSGLNSGDPYPTAQVADNDLALGRIVSEISHSPVWKDSAIFVVEDDPQNGVDHVDGHRTPALVISPYSNQGAVDHSYYTQINMVKTIEQILGIPPMNQEDRAAVPMFTAFTDKPNFAPYDYKPNNIPLDLGVAVEANASAASLTRTLRIPAREVRIYRAWVAWSAHQHFTGSLAAEDRANPAQLNRVDWYAATNWRRPYPGDRKILAPNQVPGRNRPAADIGGN
jgi:YVTN family beta-propeller protein